MDGVGHAKDARSGEGRTALSHFVAVDEEPDGIGREPSTGRKLRAGRPGYRTA
ncbi:hypothetical protein SDC9_136187 [bioreactor metagenome]|uniref:Uncharacterized protein n=1 Tax=bioreactor metagenome TaxID=1076179 RepID=A0A645DIF6_9ZZZZ